MKYYYPVYPPFIPYYYRPFPAISPNTFIESAKTIPPYLKDLTSLAEKISSDRQYSEQLMNAAQESDQQKVDSLIQGLNLEHSIKTTYTPDGVRFEISSTRCRVSMSLRWR
ncbi:hypothetical protein LC087_09960 [Bacillus carboniphilus]|uniref:Uncharacterized protein n=1 Tax=Bacillus carboniphilus TaxID=86663 RepID=A0ABY9JPM4_9BACI|nr:hypothetical protein [Bacillus carboniphilus]WLR41262.1 hypothetical protein LC087_09960 [Bacillus carboniphilus]